MRSVTGKVGEFSNGKAGSENPEALALAAELREEIDGEVRFDNGSRALYSTDYSIYRQVPIGVVVPKSTEDVVKTVAACRKHGAPILSRGCGTSPNGQCCNVAVVMDHSKYLRGILDLEDIVVLVTANLASSHTYHLLSTLDSLTLANLTALVPESPRCLCTT